MAENAALTTRQPFQFSPFDLAPDTLMQAINPWVFSGEQVGLVNISIGETRHPDVERTILDEVGSYGRQLGHIGDVLQVLVDRLDRTVLEEHELEAVKVLEGELVRIKRIKRRMIED